MKKFGMLIRVSCSLNNHQAYLLFTCFLKSKKKKKKLNKIPTNMPVKTLY